MKLLPLVLVALFALISFFFSTQPPEDSEETSVLGDHMNDTHAYSVVRVVDGDTIVVTIDAKQETVRLLGINTPESVDPRRPVECFGKEASKKLTELVGGKSVILESDPTQGDRDRYGRLLRFVYLTDDKTFVNGEMVKQGYAYSYQEYPTDLLDKLNAFESDAREHNRGLWGSCSIDSKSTDIATKDKDCDDFATRQEAQDYFDAKGGSPTNNIDRLDNNHDGVVCENMLY